MSKTIDERVVEMKFDNRDFEAKTKQSMSTLDKLKQKLNLTGASKGLENISSTAKGMNFSVLTSAVETVQSKFSALEVIGITALANITNSAVNAGKRMVSALTIDPIKTGFQEYETQINAVQTILANTSSKGTTLDDVNKALDELNVYADKTIYNFTEMTRNIGTFTAAGVDLKTSTSAIQGIANLAAVSGSTSQQASTAMYQLSQALAAGTVKLQDWNSVVNAGMGGQVFQEALKKTAKAHGVAVDEIIKQEGSFRNSLQKGWITSEILTETLGKMTQSGAAEYLANLTGVEQSQIEAAQQAVDANKDGTASYEEIAAAMAKTGKVSKDEAIEILKMADTATNAATKVKTFTQLWDTLKEAAQSGWTQSWEIIVGDFEEAKELLTNISDVIGKMIGNSAEARNKVLQEWKDLGGRTALLESFKNVFEGVSSIIKPVREAFREIFPAITASRLMDFTNNLKDLTAKIKISDETADKLKRTFKGLFSILDIGKKALTAVFKPLLEFATGSTMSSISSSILDVTASIGDFLTKLNESTSLAKAFEFVGTTISGALKLIGDGITLVFSKFNGIGNVLSKIGGVISKFAGTVKNVLGEAFIWIKENISGGDIFAGLAGAGIFALLTNLAKAFSSIGNLFDKAKEIFEGFFKSTGAFGEAMGLIKDTLTSFQQGIKVASLVGIAVAVTLLSSAIRKLSDIEPAALATSLTAIGIMIAELNAGFKTLSATLMKYPAKSVFKASLSLMAMAEAVNILATAMGKMAKLSLGEIAKGLISVKVCIVALSKSIKTISGSNITLRTSIGILALAEACKMLGDALQKFGSMSIPEIAKGLTAMGIALVEFTAVLKIMNKFSGSGVLSGSVALLIASKSLDEISENLKKFGQLSGDEIKQGLASMGGALLEFGVILGILGKFAGGSSIAGSIAILIASKSLDEISENLKKLGELSWNKIENGLKAMGGALAELVVASGALGKFAGFSGILGSASIDLLILGLDKLSDALIKFGFMSWDEIENGLKAMGGALAELVVASGALGKFAGFSGILGSASIDLLILGLDKLSNALIKFGSMSWDEIKQGLTAMGGALAELVVASGALGKFAGFSGILGSGSIDLLILGLDKLANALQKFGSMSWNKIENGLKAMGGALAELAVVSGVLGKLAGFSGIIGAATIDVAIEGLDKLANALQKFGSMSWDEIKNGLKAMGIALAEIAVVSGALGSLTGIAGLVGAGTITLASQGLGEIADALIKFGSMSWDEIENGLKAMGGALGEIGVGGLLNTLSILGNLSIAVIAKPLGDLADSFQKWADIKYEDISEGLKAMDVAFAEIAAGGLINTLSGLGSLSIATIAEPLGTLADSVMKWKDVIVPDGLGEQLASLADAIFSFTFGGLGADALATTAPAIGQMAESITKWKDVTIPEDIGTGLANIAEGIKAFSFAFAGGWSLSAITGPLGDLSESITKWKDVTIPKGIKTGLTHIAEGVEAFNFLFVGGWSLSAINGPLGDLAETVKKWEGVKVPDTIKDGLTNIAAGINQFTIIGAVKLSSIAEPLNLLGDAFKNFASVNSTGNELIQFAEKLKNTCNKLEGLNSEAVDKASNTVNKLSNIVKKINDSNVSSIDSFVTSVNKLNEINIGEINVDTSSLAASISAIQDTITTIESTISNSKSSLDKAMETAVSGLSNAITTVKDSTASSMDAILTSLVSKISSFRGKVTTAFKNVVSGGSDAINNSRSSFVSAGSYLGDGLVEGINSKQAAAYNAGYALGQAAVQGEKDGQKSHSPSKLTIQAGKWLGEGLIIGISSMTDKVSNAGNDIGEKATKSISSALNTVNTLLNSDIDSNPRIRPILDLSDVTSGVGVLNSMFNDVSVRSNLDSISYGMNAKLQNGVNDDVITAIDQLRKDLSNINGDTYNINGVTYDDGSNITDAVQTLVRAARIERRV